MLGALLMVMILAACETAPPPPDLPPVHPAGRTTTVEPPVNPDLPRAQARVYVQQMLLPLDLPSDAGWEKIDEAAFPAVTRSVWNANALRVGLISRADVPALVDALPKPYSNQQQMVAASTYPVAIRRSPPLNRPFTVDLTIPPLAVREERIVAGRAQLLLSVDANHTLYLTPHHHKLQPQIMHQVEQLRRERLEGDGVPQTPSLLDKELEGRIFEELTLGVPRGGRVLVVGLCRPWPLNPDAPDPSAESAVQPPTDPWARYDLAHPPPLHDDLGAALFTAIVGGKPAQVLLLISLDTLDAPMPR